MVSDLTYLKLFKDHMNTLIEKKLFKRYEEAIEKGEAYEGIAGDLLFDFTAEIEEDINDWIDKEDSEQ